MRCSASRSCCCPTGHWRCGGEPREQLEHIQRRRRAPAGADQRRARPVQPRTGEIRLESAGGRRSAACTTPTVPLVTALAHAHGVRLTRGELAHDGAGRPDAPAPGAAQPADQRHQVQPRRRPACTCEAHACRRAGACCSVRDSGRGMSASSSRTCSSRSTAWASSARASKAPASAWRSSRRWSSAWAARVARAAACRPTAACSRCGCRARPLPPRTAGAAARRRADRRHPAPAACAPGALLYIEDNPVNALIVRELIAQRGDLTLDDADDGAQRRRTGARRCSPT